MASERLTSNEGMNITKLDFEMAQSRSRKRGRISISRTQVVGIVLCFICLLVLVGLLCFYEARRQFHSDDQKFRPDPSRAYDVGGEITPSALTITTNSLSEGSYAESSVNDGSSNEEPWGGRLPLDVIPESYHLHIQPFINEEDVEGTDKESFTFDGSESPDG